MLSASKSLFLWQKEPDTLEDLEDVLTEPPPAPGASYGVSLPEFTPASVGDALPLSSNSRCPLLEAEEAAAAAAAAGQAPAAQQESEQARQPGQPTDAGALHGQRQCDGQPAGVGEAAAGWLCYLPGARVLLRRTSDASKAAGVGAESGASGGPSGEPEQARAAGEPSAPSCQPCVQGTASERVAAAGTAHSDSPHAADAPAAPAPPQPPAPASDSGWSSYLHWPTLPVPLPGLRASGIAAVPPPMEQELAPLGASSGGAASSSPAAGEAAAGEAGPAAAAAQPAPGHLAAALQHTSAALQQTWHTAETAATSTTGAVVVGAVVGTAVALGAGPLGVAVAVGAKSAIVAAGAIGGGFPFSIALLVFTLAAWI